MSTNSPYKTEWDLTLLYASHTDPQIETDCLFLEKTYTDFASKYEGVDFTASETSLYEAIRDWEALTKVAGTWKPVFYFQLAFEINSADTVAQERATFLEQRLQKSANKIVFFTLAMGKISPETQAVFLNSKLLAPYRYFLKQIFDNARFDLTLKEEQLLSLMHSPAAGMWRDFFSKQEGKKMVVYKGEEIPLSQAIDMVSDLPLEERRVLGPIVMEAFKDLAPYAEGEINALYTYKKISDELRGYSRPDEGTIRSYQNELSTVDTLTEVVTRRFAIAQEFYEIKAKVLKLDTLHYEDRAASFGTTTREYSFDESIEILRASFSRVGVSYVNHLNEYLQKGQIDVYPRKSKTSGGFCISSQLTPTFILLNHTNSFKSVNTFAHEMGHAFHAELSKIQPPLYRDHTISIAEVASTLFENLANEVVFESLSPKEKIVALHDRINTLISQIFRQVAVYNFERELHARVRAQGFVQSKEISELMNTHMAAYLGPRFTLEERDGYYWVGWSHIRRYFYVYSYAFGSIISTSLWAEYKKDPSFWKKIEQFLSAGGSDSPENIFKSIGIDITQPDFFAGGLTYIESEIARLKKILQDEGMI
jgi:oligoendopeptidase F